MKQFKDLPKRIQEQMLKEQVAQGNERNEQVFIDDIWATSEYGGFDCDETELGKDNWTIIIDNDNYETFYEIYGEDEEINFVNIDPEIGVALNEFSRLQHNPLKKCFIACSDEKVKAGQCTCIIQQPIVIEEKTGVEQISLNITIKHTVENEITLVHKDKDGLHYLVFDNELISYGHVGNKIGEYSSLHFNGENGLEIINCFLNTRWCSPSELNNLSNN